MHSEHASHGGHGDHGGHGGHAGHVAHFRRLFWIMTVIAIPVVACSAMFAQLIGYSLPDNPIITWVSPILGTLMYFWGGRPFLSGGVEEIKNRQPGMMLLIALAITVAFASSWLSTLSIISGDLDFWWELALLIVIMLLGHWIEMRSLAQTSSALDSLAALLPDEAERVVDGEIEKVAPADLQVDDEVLVRPGGSVPADGDIIDGSSSMDESMVTGESTTVSKSAGDHVVAGTISTDSSIRVRITAVGDDTTLAGINKLVEDAQESSSRTQRLADRAAAWLFWYALGAAILTAIVWFAIGRPDSAVVRTITVLVIACPHALGLAIPLVVSIATERAARHGILIKDRLALETMRKVNAVLFDKTGTLTAGQPQVLDVEAVGEQSADTVLAWAAAAEMESEHPLAKAIVSAAQDRNVTIPDASDHSSQPAVGVSATIDAHTVEVGGPALLDSHGRSAVEATDQWSKDGAIVLHVLSDGEVVGAIKLGDEVRPESRKAIEDLHASGTEVVMITGDAEAVAHKVADELNIDRVFAGVRPEDKASQVEKLQHEGKTVAMVGDGVNDAPALAQADVGVAIGAGTDVAIGSAGVILASDDPRGVLAVRTLSRATYRKMKQNLWWAAGYNLISVPLAAGVLAPIGFVMPMSVGALLMSASTVIVALNAQTLRKVDLGAADY
ncbi:heavy metal translocating P-type ATPase [Corynebacterium falsenii]|nr:heavy metal translocating P-type ATPase [Corynebacterium falsenii]MDC7104548.1 heavy metal translocating P-type ATPase [Corynebacterium falsenii]UBI05729.1 heavy metal translocating P-type ATPase [Corynebacterium falsenii]